MASNENGATYGRAMPSALAALPTSTFDADERGATKAVVAGVLRPSALAGFDVDDNGATHAATPTTTLPRPPATATTYYKMRALDLNCAPAKTYRTWVVTGSPDTTGAHYVGVRCGASVSFGDIVVEDTWKA